MINASIAFRKNMKKNRAFMPYVKISFADGRILSLGPESFLITGNSISDSKEDGVFPIGQVICKTIELYIINDKKYSFFDFYKSKIKLTLKIKLDGYDELFEIEKGEYTALKSEIQGEHIHIIASDDLYRLDSPYITELEFPTTIQEMIYEAHSRIFPDYEYVSTPYPDIGNATINKKPNINTYREFYSYLAKMDYSYVKYDPSYGPCFERTIFFDNYFYYPETTLADGGFFDYNKPYLSGVNFEGGSFSPWNKPEFSKEGGDGGEFSDNRDRYIIYEFKNLVYDTENIEVTGIQALFDHDSNENTDLITYIRGKEGYIVDIDNPLLRYMEHFDFSNIFGPRGTPIGSYMRRFSADSFSDPLIEFGDYVFIVDNNNGVVFGTTLTSVNYDILGYTHIQSDAESILENQRKLLPGEKVILPGLEE